MYDVLDRLWSKLLTSRSVQMMDGSHETPLEFIWAEIAWHGQSRYAEGLVERTGTGVHKNLAFDAFLSDGALESHFKTVGALSSNHAAVLRLLTTDDERPLFSGMRGSFASRPDWTRLMMYAFMNSRSWVRVLAESGVVDVLMEHGASPSELTTYGDHHEFNGVSMSDTHHCEATVWYAFSMFLAAPDQLEDWSDEYLRILDLMLASAAADHRKDPSPCPLNKAMETAMHSQLYSRLRANEQFRIQGPLWFLISYILVALRKRAHTLSTKSLTLL
jgi:hypothetical protein